MNHFNYFINIIFMIWFIFNKIIKLINWIGLLHYNINYDSFSKNINFGYKDFFQTYAHLRQEEAAREETLLL